MPKHDRKDAPTTRSRDYDKKAPRLPDPFEVQRQVEREVLGLHMAQKLF